MCQDCRISNLERKKEQFEEPKDRPQKKGGYPSKSKKVYRDRYDSARKSLKQDIEWYRWGLQHGCAGSWFYRRVERSGWIAKRYREARAAAKAHGAIE